MSKETENVSRTEPTHKSLSEYTNIAHYEIGCKIAPKQKIIIPGLNQEQN